MAGIVWDSFTHDPRDPESAPLRAADSDRDLIHDLLAAAFAEGRLDRAEYDERSTGVLSARTLGELPPFVADLVPADVSTRHGRPMTLASATPTDIATRAQEHWENQRRDAVFGFLGPTLICWTIWTAINWGDFSPLPFPWPAIVMAATFLNFAKVASSRQRIVSSETRRLERKQAKQSGQGEET